MPTKHKLILNPWAGRGAGARIKARVLAALAAQGVHHDLAETQGPGHAVDLARAAADTHDAVIAVGGDGTVHEVVNGLLRAADGQVTRPLGIVPVGSGDDFAHIVGIPRHDVPAAVERIARGQTRLVDVGRVNDQYFDNEVGVAFEAKVTVESRKIQAPLGPLIYLLAVFRAMTRYDLPRLVIRWEGGEVDRTMLMASVANGRRAGGAFRIAPNASIDDGQLDLLLADAIGRLEILRLLPKVIRGSHIHERPVTMARSPWVTIESPVTFPVHADGEVIYTDARRLELEVLPGRLRVLV